MAVYKDAIQKWDPSYDNVPVTDFQSSVLVIASNSESLGQRVIEYCSRRRDDFPGRLKTGEPRLVEVRVTKIGADFSGHAESRVDRG